MCYTELHSLLNLARRIRRHPRSILSFFDDAGGLILEKGRYLVKVDGFAMSRALYPWCSYEDFGFRAITAAVSDVFAKGCRPLIYAISIGLRMEHMDRIENVLRGIDAAVELYGGYVENIDTNAGEDGWIDVFIVAECRINPIKRIGMKVMDEIVVPKKLGIPYIAYYEHYVLKRTPMCNEVKSAVCRPIIDPGIVDFIEELYGHISASIDISDTFGETLYILSMLNNQGLYIYTDPHKILHPIAIGYAHRFGIPLEDVVIKTHEEYVPLLAMDPSYLPKAENVADKYGFEVMDIGFVTIQKSVLWKGFEVPIHYWSHRYGAVL